MALRLARGCLWRRRRCMSCGVIYHVESSFQFGIRLRTVRLSFSLPGVPHWYRERMNPKALGMARFGARARIRGGRCLSASRRIDDDGLLWPRDLVCIV